ncbi:phosphatidylinositol N-acetylglucosaminyltransferase subunit H, partial [Scheffersomyces amazonensis]|uniref:phosphatidylinositol N-acetylglucosaminyltransferase subunit H n=1 Tax=Scheffersomyces amazonensis TaxID=1078765 RepID=UPI00315C9DEF
MTTNITTTNDNSPMRSSPTNPTTTKLNTMGSSGVKDYVLHTTPKVNIDDPFQVASLNSVKFTIRNRRASWIVKYRLHLIVLLISVAGGFMYQNQILPWNHLTISNSDVFTLGGLIILLALVLLKQEPQDTLIVMKGIGLQLQSVKSWKLIQNQTNHFIPLKNTIDLVIHEGFHNYGQVIFYLCILTKTYNGNGKEIIRNNTNHDNLIKVVFPEFLPKKDTLLQVWRLSRELLYGDVHRYWRRVPGQGLKQV